MEELSLKTFYLKKKVIFPYCTMAVFVRPTDESKDIKKGDQILAFTVRSTLDLLWYRNRLATLSEVMDVQADSKSVKILLKGLMRVKVTKLLNFKRAEFEFLKPQVIDHHDGSDEELRKKSQELIFLINVEESDKLIKLLNYIFDLNQMTDFISNYFVMDFRTRYRLYRETDVKKRSVMLIEELAALIERLTKKRKKKQI
jgi:ATP-dependent Lon protease